MEEGKIFLGPVRIIESEYMPEDMIFLGNIKAFEYKPKILIAQEEVPWKMQMIIESRFGIAEPNIAFLLAVTDGMSIPEVKLSILRRMWLWFRTLGWLI